MVIYSGFTHYKWVDLSIAMLVITRGYTVVNCPIDVGFPQLLNGMNGWIIFLGKKNHGFSTGFFRTPASQGAFEPTMVLPGQERVAGCGDGLASGKLTWLWKNH